MTRPSPPRKRRDFLGAAFRELDFAAGANRQSRLACQIKLTADITSLDVKMPRGVMDNSR
jgi:ferredoxin